ncbi:MAG: hypothetical protein KKB30_14825 [Proteobacteria bacterium]|nr:hypothetical protein [Pseudomonadota bacterium]MBU1715718.1 hypothetical protein [Pseudomonadota bacterium]
MPNIKIEYNFRLPDNTEEVFKLELDDRSLELIKDHGHDLPGWTNLDFHQCTNCSLNLADFPICPLAASLYTLIKPFDNIISYDQIELTVITDERRVSQTTTAQRGISSLMGLLFATSPCPHTYFFRPMARFHLPLANEEETLFRATSMYLLAQYFRQNDGFTPDHDFTGLQKIYKEIEVVNISIAKRLRFATRTDSSLNAITLLDMYAKGIPYLIKDSLEEIRYLFAPYLQDHLEKTKTS